MSIPKDVQEAMAYAAEIFDDCDNGEWATIRTHIAAQNAEIERHAAMVEKLRELSKDCNDSALTLGVEGLRGQCIEASKTIRSILSTEPAMRSANATDAQTEVKK